MKESTKKDIMIYINMSKDMLKSQRRIVAQEYKQTKIHFHTVYVKDFNVAEYFRRIMGSSYSIITILKFFSLYFMFKPVYDTLTLVFGFVGLWVNFFFKEFFTIVSIMFFN